MFFENNYIIYYIVFTILFFIGIVFFKYFYFKNKNIGALFLLLSFLFLIINIFGIKIYSDISNNNEGGKVLFMLDVSKSMNVYDIEDKTSRLDISKLFIKDFLLENNGNYYSLGVFAGTTLEILPFTNNLNLFLKVLSGVNDKNISEGGSSLSRVFESILTYFPGKEYGTVVIFTDGGDENPEILKDILSKIKDKKINIIIAGVGTKNGGYILEGLDPFGRANYKMYNGQKVVSKLNTSYLKDLSNDNNFKYIEINSRKDFNKFKSILSENISKNLQVNSNTSNNTYLTRYFILISFVFFIIFLLFDNNILGRKK